jgi:hypothetical protein
VALGTGLLTGIVAERWCSERNPHMPLWAMRASHRTCGVDVRGYPLLPHVQLHEQYEVRVSAQLGSANLVGRHTTYYNDIGERGTLDLRRAYA